MIDPAGLDAMVGGKSIPTRLVPNFGNVYEIYGILFLSAGW